ncbi:MAG: cysteinyl-tRNA synthetase [Parasphingorhabdus sp.]|jgi:cysteinyl-tRNA synthetase
MALHLHNTLKREKLAFVPINPDRITMYVCGPTVYNFIHIGNARPVVVFDVLYRLLKHIYPTVVYARNITDVDDKINKAAIDNSESISDVAERFTEAFHADIASLNTLQPDIEPRATDHISQMVTMIEKLISDEHAYKAEGHVLFSVPSMADYGRLSGRNREDLIAGARVEVAPYKRDPADFVLWKPSDTTQPGWDSPWGNGRPGWHLECSAMIEAHLGNQIDIHGGGLDLIFPHHENEIAQSVCAHSGESYVNYWLHNGYITMSGEKMSKSVGNFYTLRDLLDLAPGEAIRYALLSGHYRKPLDWSSDTITQARSSLDRWYKALELASDISIDDDVIPESVISALEDDLNTPLALSELHAIATSLNSANNNDEKRRYKSQLLGGGRILGFLENEPESWFKSLSNSSEGPDEDKIQELISARADARNNRNFKQADAIRNELLSQGVALEDTVQGTKWSRT